MPESQVREAVARYLAGMISAGELEHVLPDGWDLDESASDESRKGVLVVMGLIAEFMAGDLQEPELRKHLEPYAAWRVERRYSAGAVATAEAATPETEQAFGAGKSLLVGSV